MFSRFFSYRSSSSHPSGRSDGGAKSSTSKSGFVEREDYETVALLTFSIRRDPAAVFVAGRTTGGRVHLAAAIVPRLVNLSGKTIDQGKVGTGVTGITLAIYSEETGGSPRWLETRNVQADSKGKYTAQLGVTKSEGLVEHSVMRARLPQAMKEMKAARAVRLAPVDHNLLETASAPDKP